MTHSKFQSPKIFSDSRGMSVPLINTLFLSAIAWMLSVQIFVILMWTAHLVQGPSALLQTVFPAYAARAGHTQWSFGVLQFLCVCAVVQGFILWLCRRKIHDAAFLRRWQLFATVEAVLVFLLLSALFKIAVYSSRPQLATAAFYAILGIAVLNKIFWPEIQRGLIRLYETLKDPARALVHQKIATALCLIGILVVIYVPNLEPALARVFFGEQFHHLDGTVVGPIWAYATGCVLNIDIISRYGVGLPIVLTWLTKLLGGITYLNILKAIVLVVMIYYVLCFALLRSWFSSLAVAAATILVAIRVQMFHTGEYPMTFYYPTSTATRFFCDIFVLWIIFWHLKNARTWLLALGGAMCGVAIFYLTSEGVYLTLGFYAYVLFHLWLPYVESRRWPSIMQWAEAVVCVLLPPVIFVVLAHLVNGPNVDFKEFMSNMGEFINFFLSGFGTNPITQSLKSHLFLQSLMGFIYPLVYVFTLIYVVSLWFFRKTAKADLIVAVLCVYGLGLYHYYVTLSMWTSYYMNGLPFILICGWWADRWVKGMSRSQRGPVLIWMVGLSLWALLTNHNFISYPNILNVSRNPMVDPLVAQPLPNGRPYLNHLFYEYPDAFKLPVNSLGEKDEHLKAEGDFASDRELVEYYRQESDFSKDAGMIARLTDPKQGVPLISSFELMILMQANRKPFFYYCPIINSRPMRMRNFVVTAMYAKSHLERTLAQLEDEKPPYVFMERILMTSPVPQAYFYDSPGLFELLNYVFERYEFVEQGQYLAAWKRKKSGS